MNNYQKQLVVALYVQYGTGAFSYLSLCEIRDRIGVYKLSATCTIPALKQSLCIEQKTGKAHIPDVDCTYVLTEHAVWELQNG